MEEPVEEPVANTNKYDWGGFLQEPDQKMMNVPDQLPKDFGREAPTPPSSMDDALMYDEYMGYKPPARKKEYFENDRMKYYGEAVDGKPDGIGHKICFDSGTQYYGRFSYG